MLVYKHYTYTYAHMCMYSAYEGVNIWRRLDSSLAPSTFPRPEHQENGGSLPSPSQICAGFQMKKVYRNKRWRRKVIKDEFKKLCNLSTHIASFSVWIRLKNCAKFFMYSPWHYPGIFVGFFMHEFLRNVAVFCKVSLKRGQFSSNSSISLIRYLIIIRLLHRDELFFKRFSLFLRGSYRLFDAWSHSTMP